VSRRPQSRLRRSLSISTLEGLVAELFNACAGPTLLVAWALHLRCTPAQVGLVAALPQLGQIAQLPAAWATARLGGRRVALVAVGLSRQALLPLALLPLAPLSPAAARGVLFAVAGGAALLATAGNHAWTAWMAELVPAPLRGRYFGRRTAVCVLGGGLAAFAAARLLDRGGGARAAWTLAALTVAASALGAATTALLARQHAPPAPAGPPPCAAAALGPLADPGARRLLVYQVAWNGSVGLAGGYFTLFLLRDLGASFTVVALHGAGSALARTLSAPLWGRAIDRVGARPVLAACSFGAAVLPLLWLAASPRALWPIAVDAALGGLAWGGHGLAAFAVPLAVAPRRERSFHLAAFSLAGGAAYAAATALGGQLAARPAPLPALGAAGGGLGLVFLLSATGRLASAGLALRIAERGAGTLGELRRVAHGAARAALAAALAR
jgi:MFS transporter